MKQLFFLAIIVGLVGCGKSEDPEKGQSVNTLPKPISDDPYWKYTKEDFPRYFEQWGEDGVKRISEIERAAVAKIANTQNSCDRISMAMLSEDRSTPKSNVVVIVDCDNKQRFYVSESALNIGAPIKSQSEKSISQADAFIKCQELVKSNAKYPSSVDFQLLDSSGFKAETTGNVVVNLGFKAKNSFGAEIPAKARCVFPPDKTPEITISE
ncbi:hypothetical protein EC844_11929 [Acinetobacter calcoaceticus]|uniref:Lipoprotein n=1 Tax=Acinetobacter calcoaceticus TaxID=471 RepID=A0A4R1XPI7_ACICA|nr:hypothetical protein EC844_11929 [Acinetobacter calcoaceticus]